MIQNSDPRQFKVLRLSVTAECNFACKYCVSKDDIQYRTHHTSLSPEEYGNIVRKIHQINKLSTVRLTGGEPTLYKGLIDLVGILQEIGIPEIHLTTNGSHLEGQLDSLIQNGLTGINFSLDAIDKDIFRKLTGRDQIEKVLSCIDRALKYDISIKINTTLMKGINDSQIIPLLEYASSHGMAIRFLELMKMGHLYHNYHQYLFSEQEILSTIQTKYLIHPVERKASSTANYWLTEDGKKFGIIANESSPFCGDCNRLRVDYNGFLYGCLSVNYGFPLDQAVNDEEYMKDILVKAMSQKQKEKFVGSTLSMKAIGG